MAKRLADIVLALIMLLLSSPMMLVAAVGIWVSSPGPVVYRARRVGRNGKRFTMYKFRTMEVSSGAGSSRITAQDDRRVFPFGAWLRRLKIDELPQLFNILRGDMSVVGPRPEDPAVVDQHYAPAHMDTLLAPPGLASPGSIYNYTHGERQLRDRRDVEAYYLEHLLPLKLALDLVYVREASLRFDLRIMVRTIWVILCRGLGRCNFPEPAEMARARPLVTSVRRENVEVKNAACGTGPSRGQGEENVRSDSQTFRG